LMNTDEKSRDLAIRAEGLPGLKVVGVEQPIALGAGATKLVALRLQAVLDGNAESGALKREHDEHDQQDELGPGTHKIEFIVQAVDDDKVVRHEKSSFIIPR
jgi:hypothetical protein